MERKIIINKIQAPVIAILTIFFLFGCQEEYKPPTVENRTKGEIGAEELADASSLPNTWRELFSVRPDEGLIEPLSVDAAMALPSETTSQDKPMALLSSEFWVQIASYTSRSGVERGATLYRKRKIEVRAFKLRDQGKVKFRLEIGPFESRERAVLEGVSLKADKKISEFVINRHAAGYGEKLPIP